MTTPTASPSHHDQGWADELAMHLSPGSFPATHDHLAATLIQRHAPSHLLWHLSGLPRTQVFQSLDELVDALDRLVPPAAPGTNDSHA